MRKYMLIITAASVLFACNRNEKKGDHLGHEMTESNSIHEHADKPVETKKKPLSPRTMAMANIGDNHVHIDYGSPSKRGRVIFGGLVGYRNVWATGAHSATNINFSKDVVVNGVTISAGKYGLFTIPNESEWTIIISKDWDMHLADAYSEVNDVVRIQSPVKTLTEVQESLTFSVEPLDADEGQLTISWDMTKVGFQIKNKQ